MCNTVNALKFHASAKGRHLCTRLFPELRRCFDARKLYEYEIPAVFQLSIYSHLCNVRYHATPLSQDESGKKNSQFRSFIFLTRLIIFSLRFCGDGEGLLLISHLRGPGGAQPRYGNRFRVRRCPHVNLQTAHSYELP